VVACSALAACATVEKDTVSDYKQVVAVLWQDTADEKPLFKYQLVRLFNQQASSLISQQGMTVSAAMDYCLESLINRELMVHEVKRRMSVGAADPDYMPSPTQKQLNDLWRGIYTSIDSQLFSLAVEVAAEYKMDEPVQKATGEGSTPTYTVKAAQTGVWESYTDEDRAWLQANDEVTYAAIVPSEVAEDFEWVPEAYRAPKADDILSLEALRRFVQLMINNIEPAYLTADETVLYNQDKALLASYANKNGAALSQLYFDIQRTFVVQYYFYRDQYDGQLLTNLQNFINNTTAVTNAEVQAEYNRLLAEQKTSFKTISTYTAALENTTSTTPILHHPVLVTDTGADNTEFFVKHILVPLSEAQTAELTALKATAATPEEIEARRAQLCANITTYVHTDGYDDLSVPQKTIAQVMAEVKAAMSGRTGWNAEQKFEELIYKYNTDPGIFNNPKGYGLRAADKSSYVAEFEAAAKALYEAYVADKTKTPLGTVYADPVVTDFGVHIMMLSSVVKPQDEAAMSDFTTVMWNQTVKQQLTATVRTNKLSNAYTNYEKISLQKFRADADVQTYAARYADIIKSAGG
jgi:parvulin-like peptidyl-prolyl isomerase